MKVRFSLLSIIIVGLLTTGCGIMGGGTANSKVQYAQYVGGYWGQWKTFYSWGFQGRPNSFVVYRGRDTHPSNYCFKITVNNFTSNYIPKGEEKSFSGTIEYTTNVNDNNPSRYDYHSQWFVETDLPSLSYGYFKTTRPARIVIEKKRNLYFYNIFFDNVGFAITIPWKD